jgi:hypothetical protein
MRIYRELAGLDADKAKNERGQGPCSLIDESMAELTGFEPAVSCVTGRHVGPLHHSSMNM